jgi:hypothetical protein
VEGYIGAWVERMGGGWDGWELVGISGLEKICRGYALCGWGVILLSSVVGVRWNPARLCGLSRCLKNSHSELTQAQRK